MSREVKGESGVMQAWLETSITGLHALVGRIQVYSGNDDGICYAPFQGSELYHRTFMIRLAWKQASLVTCRF